MDALLGLIVIWFCFGIASFVVAENRGSSGCLFGLFGVFFGPIALGIAFLTGTTCAHCGKRISEKATICPYCHVKFTIVAGNPVVSNMPINKQAEPILRETLGTTKKCPYCAEDIKLEAIKCKHCGSMLGSVTPPVIAPNEPPGESAAAATELQPSMDNASLIETREQEREPYEWLLKTTEIPSEVKDEQGGPLPSGESVEERPRTYLVSDKQPKPKKTGRSMFAFDSEDPSEKR